MIMPENAIHMLLADAHSAALHHMCAWSHGRRACMMYNHAKMVNDGHVHATQWNMGV